MGVLDASRSRPVMCWWIAANIAKLPELLRSRNESHADG